MSVKYCMSNVRIRIVKAFDSILDALIQQENFTNSPVILWFNLELIATQAFLTVSGTEKCAL